MSGARDEGTRELAASGAAVEVAGAPVEVELAPAGGGRGAREGRRLLLRLADVERLGKAGSYDVYLGLPAGARPDEHPAHLAGRISLYGPPARAQEPPRRFQFVLDVSKLRPVIVAALADGAHPLRVTIAPADDWSEPVTVGRVALHAG